VLLVPQMFTNFVDRRVRGLSSPWPIVAMRVSIVSAFLGGGFFRPAPSPGWNHLDPLVIPMDVKGGGIFLLLSPHHLGEDFQRAKETYSASASQMIKDLNRARLTTAGISGCPQEQKDAYKATVSTDPRVTTRLVMVRRTPYMSDRDRAFASRWCCGEST